MAVAAARYGDPGGTDPPHAVPVGRPRPAAGLPGPGAGPSQRPDGPDGAASPGSGGGAHRLRLRVGPTPVPVGRPTAELPRRQRPPRPGTYGVVAAAPPRGL